MHWLLTSVTTLMLALASVTASVTGDARATELLAQARVALGGENKLARIERLSCSGTYRRQMGGRELSGDLSIDLQLPDKMLRTETMNPMGDATVTTEVGVNGDQPLRNSRTMGGGPNLIVRVGGPAGPDVDAQMVRRQRADLARLAIAFLLTPPASMPLEFSFAGEAEADADKADVIDAKGPGSFAARLFLDRKTHRPLMLSYRGVAPRIVMATERMHGVPDRSRIERAERAAADAHPEEAVDITMFLDEYRQVDGVWLPHHISRSIDGKPAEEWTFTTIKVNPAFKADTFSVK